MKTALLALLLAGCASAPYDAQFCVTKKDGRCVEWRVDPGFVRFGR